MDTTEIDTPAGRVRGVRRRGSAAFLGIPFAEPPVEHLRFAAPVRHHPWHGILDATRYGSTPQRGIPAEPPLIPEPSIPGPSTLNVNVFTPRPDSGAALPVMVYIHGGGYFAGSPASPWYDGASFNRDGVITVTISYRLGFDGFGWIEDAPHNRGVLDWILALEWVRDNIRAFGGDPTKVTIAGQSAGGGAVLTLLATPSATDLFQGAIAMSGATVDLSLAKSESAGRSLAGRGGVAPTRAGLSTLSEARILELQNEISSFPGKEDDTLSATMALVTDGLLWGPVVDEVLIPEATRNAIDRGVGNGKALLLGATDHEFNIELTSFEGLLSGRDPAAMLTEMGLPEATVDSYLAGYPARGTAETIGQYISDRLFRAPARTIAESRARHGAPTWLYRFSWPSPVIGDASHCVELPFFFDALKAEGAERTGGDDPPTVLADDVHGAAVSFLINGEPGWPPYETANRFVRRFDTPSATITDGYANVAALSGT